jgi:hypothetical protein
VNLLSKVLSAFTFHKINHHIPTVESSDVGADKPIVELNDNYFSKTNSMAKKTVITRVLEVETSEAIVEFPQNRALVVEQLTDDPPAKAEIIKNLRTMEDVFVHFKPNVNVEFEDLQGQTKKENLSFNELRDFELEGMIKKSDFLKELGLLKDSYEKIEKQLRTNKVLRDAVSDSESRNALIQSMQALLKELKDSK